jgi:NCAIR mutase (PurE)-related protein
MSDLRAILQDFANGRLSLAEAQKQISLHAIEDVGQIARLDIGRHVRKGVPEVVLAEHKQLPDINRIALAAIKRNNQVLISRIKKQDMNPLLKRLKKDGVKVELGLNSSTLLASAKSFKGKPTGGTIGIIAAGTSDIGVAEEARLMAKAMCCDAIAKYDVGIAGMHRVFPVLKQILTSDCSAIVVVAGMEGALASVVASMVDVPVIGVPTSIGYGFGSDGVAALASMLQSCTLGLAVVNIDNGIAAGAIAASIANRMKR